MADTGIYGNPFSYITSGVKEPKTSSKISDPAPESDGEESQENKQPFSYLSTDAPSAKVLRSASDAQRLERPNKYASTAVGDNVFYDRNSNSKEEEKKLDFDSLYQPPPANHYVASTNHLNGYQSSTLPIQHAPETSYTELGRLPGANDGKGLYYSGEYASMQRPYPNHQNQQVPNGTGGLPRTYVGDVPYSDPAPHPPESPQSPRSVRPSTRDSAMGESYRSNSYTDDKKDGGKRKYVSCFCVTLVIIVGLVALVAGFIAGWFIQAMLMSSVVTTTSVPIVTNPNTPSMSTSPATPIPASSGTTMESSSQPPTTSEATTTTTIPITTTTTTTTPSSQPP